MPLLEIATAQPNFRNHLGALGAQAFVHGSSSSGARLEPSEDDGMELDEREKLRRMRISKANKGNTPWNKGRKHSAETLQRIRERTRLAMQNPKVKMKLINLGHAQSEKTRLKIGVGVRMGWQRRREKLMVQETCYNEWQNLIAEASRKGYVGEEELRWDSYDMLNEQLEREWLESVEQRKTMLRPKGSKRAPKSPEQRRKIAEAIAAKWADPEYRERVCSGLAKYHGTPVGVERKPRRKPADAGGTRPRKRSPSQKKSSDMDSTPRLDHQSQIQKLRLKRRKTPLFKDPLASSKLELIKSIRAHRAAQETNKTEAIARARLLIAEAERAAKALEAAAVKSPIARASLAETRKLIAEAIQSIESIDIGSMPSTYNGSYPSAALPDLINHIEEETATVSGNRRNRRKVNGSQVKTWEDSDGNFDFGGFSLPDVLDEEGELDPIDLGFVPLDLEARMDHSGERHDIPEPNGLVGGESRSLPNGTKTNVQSTGSETCSKPIAATKKWVRGRLVDAAD
ncbi:uncharacterized protein LOC115683707 isoform X2 [Syzygium oleosum]|uniref:uncharacterized protein LOC115683707 isoform X2 n=1 Tax=Syzygium oleosum TaxID=219896 RepID=UPI0024B8E083|nr:uncharacterized protein LOC115683707 isoform X2 [Syzygium oleosum]